MGKLAKNKAKFIGMSCLSISCLFASFAYPLQKLEIWRQSEIGAFGIVTEKTFIISESDLDYPFGFNDQTAVLIRAMHRDYKMQKILLLVLAIVCGMYANSIGYKTCIDAEIDSEVDIIEAQSKKQLTLEGVKHRFAMASKAQKLLFLDEMKAMMEEFGSPEQDILEADEINATDKFVNANYLLLEGHPIDVVVSQTWGYQPNTPEHTQMKRKFEEWQNGDSDAEALPAQEQETESDFRTVFSEDADMSYWKAAAKALKQRATEEDIVENCFQCRDLKMGLAYLAFLKQKFM
jgi:hypothetical protein